MTKAISAILFSILFIVTVSLRFIHLSYSDYIRDEHKTFYDERILVSPWQFFMEQRKGPMQVIVSLIPYLITHDYRNELAQRIPYSLISTISVFLFYWLVYKLSKSKVAAFIAAFLFTVNGFMVAFGRIVQYQNLNLLFSFLSLIFYASLLEKNEKHLLKSILGTVMFSLSLMSHWDAVLILPAVFYMVIRFLLNPEHPGKYKLRILLFNILIGSLILLPFLIPYVREQLINVSNQRYLNRRVGLGKERELSFRTLYELYNPFVSYWFYIVTGILGAIFIRKSFIFFIWFTIDFIIFYLFVHKPGTHIYNFIIPLIALSSIGIERVIHYFPKFTKIVPVAALLIIGAFFYYQSYLIFVDQKIEYPWKQEKIWKWVTPDYEHYPTLPLFGFPLRRNWDEINDFINNQNRINNEKLGYMTNEDASTSSYYMDTQYKSSGTFYYVAIKRPLNFVNDWNAAQIKGKKLVHTIEINGETMVKIYRVEPREKSTEHSPNQLTNESNDTSSN